MDEDIVDVIADTLDMTEGCSIKKLGPGTDIKNVTINSGTVLIFENGNIGTLTTSGDAEVNVSGNNDGAVLKPAKGAHANCKDHDIITSGGAEAFLGKYTD